MAVGTGLAAAAARLGDLLLRVPRGLSAVFALAWMGWIHWLSSAPRGLPVGGFWGSYLANLGHGPLYGVLSLGILAALPRRREPRPWVRLEPRDVGVYFALVAAYGALDEWHQSTVSGRHASLLDLGTNLTAAAAVLLAAWAAGQGARAPRLLVRIVPAGLLGVALAALFATVA